MKRNTAGTQALCRIPGDVECMLKHSASKCFSVAFWVHTTKAERERERERSTCSIRKKVVQKILDSTKQLIELKIIFIVRLCERKV
jgi:hypothetical protein